MYVVPEWLRIPSSAELWMYFFNTPINTEYFPYLQFRYAVIGCLIYLFIYFAFLKFHNNTDKTTSKILKSKDNSVFYFNKLKAFMFMHNMLLSIFSLLCFINTVPSVYRLFLNEKGWIYACQEGWKNEFYNTKFGLWAYYFYISKYYEFVDTWIIMYRGHKPSFLQIFHHFGAVLLTWGTMTYRSTAAWIFIVFNSFIHSFMYFYYACTVLKIKCNIINILKQSLTIMQILQFIIGNSIAIAQIIIYKNIIAYYDQVGTMIFIGYSTTLLILFLMFYRDTYGKNNKNKMKNV